MRTRQGFVFVLMVVIVALVALLVLVPTPLGAQDGCSGEYKVDDVPDTETYVGMLWQDTPGFACDSPPDTAGVNIKAGNDEPTGTCFEFGWNDEGWGVYETGAAGCKDMSHVTIWWDQEPTNITLQQATVVSEPATMWRTVLLVVAAAVIGVTVWRRWYD